MKQKPLRLVIKIDSTASELATYMADVPPHDRAKRLIALASTSLSQLSAGTTPTSKTESTINRPVAKKGG